VGYKNHTYGKRNKYESGSVTYLMILHLNIQVNRMSNNTIRKLVESIEDLRKQLPAHSIPPSMLIELEELEEKLELEKKKMGEDQRSA